MIKGLLVRPRRESNPHFKNRNLTCYPLHHEGMFQVSVTLTYYRVSLLALQGGLFGMSGVALV